MCDGYTNGGSPMEASPIGPANSGTTVRERRVMCSSSFAVIYRRTRGPCEAWMTSDSDCGSRLQHKSQVFRYRDPAMRVAIAASLHRGGCVCRINGESP